MRSLLLLRYELDEARGWFIIRGRQRERTQQSLVLEMDPTRLCYGTRPDGAVQPCWDKGDEIVVTTTDYLPGHSEKLRIKP